MINLGKYGKTIIAAITGTILWVGMIVQSPAAHVTALEWVGLATVLAQAFGVYSIQNGA